MKAIYRKRLLKLADLLDSVKPKEFDMRHWYEKELPTDTRPEVKCGTTACAMGWACTVPAFKRAGLRLDLNYETPDGTLMGDVIYTAKDKAEKREIVRRIMEWPELTNRDCDSYHHGNDFEGLEAASALFGLSDAESHDLFMPDAYEGKPTPKTVAKRIRKLVATKTKATAK